MSKEAKFADGLIYKAPRENAPDFVKGSLSVKVEPFIKFLNENNNNGWVNIDMKLSKNGKIYFQLNEWKPTELPKFKSDEKSEEEIEVKEIPF